jgi:predicted CXXCH cytochrome family protein
MRRRALLAAACLAAAIGVTTAAVACGREGAPPAGPSTGVVAQRTWEGFYRPPADRIPHALATNPGTPWGDYLGSTACKACHAAEHAGWRDSFHSRTLYDVVPATVFGDFSGKRALVGTAFAFDVRPVTEGGRFYLRITRNQLATTKPDTYGSGLPPDPVGTYEVLYAFGNRRHQPYVTKAKDGRHWVLPVVWDDVQGTFEYCGWRPYVTSCANCHVTGIKTTDRPGAERDVVRNTMPTRWNVAAQDEGWAEGAVGCETCHGPGRGHVAAVASRGPEGYRAYLAAGGAPTIYNPKRDTRERRLQQCDQCHSFLSESPVTWRPGPDGFARDPHQWRIRAGAGDGGGATALLGDTGQFFGDGHDMSPCTIGWALRDSAMGKKGVECRDCHDVHGNADWAELVRPLAKNALCLGCHATDAGGRFADGAAVARHARHAADGPGALCSECHMPRIKRFSDGIHVMSAQLPGHEFSVPTGHESDGGGPPCACNLCHTDRDAAWTREVLAAWKRGTPPPR